MTRADIDRMTPFRLGLVALLVTLVARPGLEALGSISAPIWC